VGIKRPGRGVVHPPPYSAEVKERVYLCPYNPSGFPWRFLGWTWSLQTASGVYKSKCTVHRNVW